MATVHVTTDANNRLIKFGDGQSGRFMETHLIKYPTDGTATGTSTTINTRLRKIETWFWAINGEGTAAENAPYLLEYANTDGNGAINAGGSSVTLATPGTENDIDYHITFIGY